MESFPSDFDNSGLCALTEWLNEALEERASVQGHAPGKEEILVLEIRGFPEGTNTKYKVNRGWFYQLYAPLSTLLGVWTTGQAATNVTEFDLLQKYWACKEIVLTPVFFSQTGLSILKQELLVRQACCHFHGTFARTIRI
jgi:hypothetical protein